MFIKVQEIMNKKGKTREMYVNFSKVKCIRKKDEEKGCIKWLN